MFRIAATPEFQTTYMGLFDTNLPLSQLDGTKRKFYFITMMTKIIIIIIIIS
jgi:hypothetical protein